MGGVVAGEQRVARSGDVFAGEPLGSVGVAGDDRVEDVLMLRRDIRRVEQVVGVHLADAQLDLSHEQGVHARQPRPGQPRDEGAVERDVVTGDPGVGRGVEHTAVCGDRVGGDGAGPSERGGGGGLDDRAAREQVDDVVAPEQRNASGLMRLALQEALGDQALDRKTGSRPGDAEAYGDGRLGDLRAGDLGPVDDRVAQKLRRWPLGGEWETATSCQTM